MLLLPMRESSQRPLDDVEKGERLKCIFEVLNKDKKRYERIKNTRTLSEAEQKEYDDVCTRLNSFYEKCQAFIKPRKNGPGRFMVQAYVNWCASQNIIAKQGKSHHDPPIETIDNSAHSAEVYERTVSSEQAIFRSQSFAQNIPHAQRSVEYEASKIQQDVEYEPNVYKNMGFAQVAPQEYDPNNDMTKTGKSVYKVDKPSANKHLSSYPDARDREGVDYRLAQTMRNSLSQGPIPEFDPKKSSLYNISADELSGRAVINNQPNSVNNVQPHYSGNVRQVYSSANQPGHQNFVQLGTFVDYNTSRSFQNKFQPLTFPADHVVKNPIYQNDNPQGLYGLEEDASYNGAMRCKKERFSQKSGHPQMSNAYLSEKFYVRAQMKTSQRQPDDLNTSHRNFQESHGQNLGSNQGFQTMGIPQRSTVIASQGKTYQGNSAFVNSASQHMKHSQPGKVYDAVHQKTSPRMVGSLLNVNGSINRHVVDMPNNIGMAGSSMDHFDCSTGFAYKTRPDRSLLDVDQAKELESILSDRSVNYIHSRSEPTLPANSGPIQNRNIGSSLYFTAQKASNKATKQDSRGDIVSEPLLVKTGCLDERLWPTDCIRKVKPTVAIPARRKQTVNMPIPLSPKTDNTFSFEFVCDVRQQPPVAEYRDIPVKYSPRKYTKQSHIRPECVFSGIEYDRIAFPVNKSIEHNVKNVLVGGLMDSKSKSEKEKVCETISSTYRMVKNFRTSILINPKLANICRKSFVKFCEELSISDEISKEVAIPILIHLDCILHKTLFISGMIAQSRPNQKMRIKDVELAFERATIPKLVNTNNDGELFKWALDEVRKYKTN
ncbi:uncharacterized protein VICG_00060 [Vittaforma corneae ATCC 50505]|uniref:Uncharacterized protein n=1 Tax=Vittaforma corneae (strain ATCC 50505) TaxID=993615 RepID=L2GQG2_VITCO|nr:uncharacterized protein VICG_00060 [Vittaforma corneae ATCC 50505]ELA42745.1 hypothetical protein VICG_00060 [Vittaforma corneae ATCC 50505]